MAGVKGKSGRFREPDQDTKTEVILKSWRILNKFFDSDKIPLAKKAEIASRLALKDMPEKTEEKSGSYITNIIGSFNSAAEGNLTEDAKRRIGEIRGVLAEGLSSGRPVSVN